jgi:hypothetical protein
MNKGVGVHEEAISNYPKRKCEFNRYSQGVFLSPSPKGGLASSGLAPVRNAGRDGHLTTVAP